MSNPLVDLVAEAVEDGELSPPERELLEQMLGGGTGRVHFRRNFVQMAAALVSTKRLRRMVDDLVQAEQEAAAANRRHMLALNVLTGVLAAATVLLALATFTTG